MANLRAINEAQWVGLCAATRWQVKASGGNEACASISRISRHQSFSDYGNADVSSSMPVDVLADLMAESGDVSVVRFLASQAGHEIFKLPNASDFAQLQQAIGKTTKEMGEALTAIGEGLADGKLDTQEIKVCDKEIDDVIAALVCLKNALQGAGGA